MSHWVICLKLVCDLDIQITLVLLVGLVLQDTSDLLTLLHREDLAQVEYSLLPVSVFGVWASTKADWLVTGCEVNIEPSDQCVDEVIAASIENEGGGESQISCCASVEIKGEDGGGVGYDGLNFDGVNKRFGESGVLEWRVVETVNVIPD